MASKQLHAGKNVTSFILYYGGLVTVLRTSVTYLQLPPPTHHVIVVTSITQCDVQAMGQEGPSLQFECYAQCGLLRNTRIAVYDMAHSNV